MYFCCCCQIPVLVLLRRIDSLGLFQLKHLSQIRGCQIGIGKSPTKNLKFFLFLRISFQAKGKGVSCCQTSHNFYSFYLPLKPFSDSHWMTFFCHVKTLYYQPVEEIYTPRFMIRYFSLKINSANLKPQADRERDSQLEEIEIHRRTNYILRIKSTKMCFLF